MALGLGYGSHIAGRWEEARQWLEVAIAGADQAKDGGLEGKARYQYAQVLRQQGRRPVAKMQMEQAAARFRAVQDYDAATRAVLELAQMEPNFRKREAILRAAVEEAGNNARPHLEARLLLAWAGSQFQEGNAAGAMKTYRRAIGELEKRQMPILLAEAWTGLGRVYRLHGDHDRARSAYGKAIGLLEGTANAVAKSRVLEMLALSYAATGEREQALRSLQESVALVRSAGRRVQAKRVNSAAVTYLMLGEPAKTIELLESTSRAAAHACHGRWPMSAALHKLGRHEAAVEYASQGVRECRAQGASEPLGRALRWRALSLEALGHRERAIEDAMESLRVVEQMREQLAPEDLLKRSFDGSYQQLVQEAVMWLHDSKRHAEAIEVAEQGRARAFVDLLNTARNGDVLPEDESLQGAEPLQLRSNASAKAATLPRMQSAAAGLESSILSYWIGERELYCWVVDRRGLRASVRNPVQYAVLKKLVREAGSRDAQKSRAALRELYRILIAPVEGQLPVAPGGRLTVIPHGLLFQAPFAAFVDGRGKYLIEKWETHYAPSVASLEATAGEESGGRYLLAGNPLRAAAPEEAKQLAPLPGSQREVRRIAALLPDKATVISGKRLRLDALLEGMAGAKVIHFATHAVVDPRRPFDSYLALSEGDRLTAREIYGQELQARLVVLSACRSATGEVSPDGVLGLTRAFFAAGVTRVVASIWDAADETSSVLAEWFHREYQRSGDASAALRKAQLTLLGRLRNGTMEVQTPAGPAVIAEHPALWAPFVLQGRP